MISKRLWKVPVTWALLSIIILFCYLQSQIAILRRLRETGDPAPVDHANSNITIIHVISPFKVSNCEEPFCPYDQAQSVVIASMIRARQKARVSVTLAAATFPEDKDAIPSDFESLPPLIRDTESEYPKLSQLKKLPFLQDIFDRVLSSFTSFDFLIYTNSDIILHDDFYNTVQEAIEQGYDVFTINRRIIPKSRDVNGEKRLYTARDLDEIFNQTGTKHPGHDCFIIRKDILEKITMGDVFIGSPPIANVLLLQIDQLGSNTRHFKSFELQATYHLGNDRDWTSKESKQVAKQNFANVLCGLPEWMDKCGNEEGASDPNCKRLLGKLHRFFDIKFSFRSFRRSKRKINEWCGSGGDTVGETTDDAISRMMTAKDRQKYPKKLHQRRHQGRVSKKQ